MKGHILSQPAIKYLEEIIDYFSNRNVEAGERFINKFDNKCKNLANFPNMGRSYDDIKSFLRGLPLAGYIIVYRVIDDGIEVIKVISGDRDLESLFLEDE